MKITRISIRVFAVLAFLATSGLLSGMLIWNLPPKGDRPERIGFFSGEIQYRMSHAPYTDDLEPATIDLLVQDFIPSDLSLRVTIAVRLSEEVVGNLRERLNGPLFFQEEVDANIARLDSFQLDISNVVYGDDGITSRLYLAINDFEKAGRGQWVWKRHNVEMPVTGQASQYPSDWYSFAAVSRLTIPATAVLYKNGSLFNEVPSVYRVGMERGMAGFEIRSQAGANPIEGHQFDFVLIRSIALRFFVYGLLAVVCILIVAILLWSHLSKNSSEFLLATVVAASLAILPLRSVLVSTDVSVLTRVDGILGPSVAFLLLAVT